MIVFLILAALQATPSVEATRLERVFEPSVESAWTFESDGKRIGHHTARYLGRDDLAGVTAHHFQGSVRLSAPQLGVDVLSTGDLWTDDAAHPIRFVQQALIGDAYTRVELTVAAGKQSKARIVQGQSAREIDVDVDPAAYLLADNFVSHLEVLVALLPRAKDATVKLFSGSALKGLGYTLKFKGPFEADTDGKHVKGDVFEDSLGETLRFVDGRLLECTVSVQKLVIRRSSERFEPITIAPPAISKAAADFDGEEVKIEHDGATIAGAITKKKGSKGRLPAVFFISGSGAQDRNGFSSGLDLGTHEILDHLTAQGFLVLRVDDRGAGQSSALPPDATFLDLVADARACVDFLLKRDDVDPKRVTLIGHSEGAETAPILAVERPAVAGIVLMAPPGRSAIEIIVDQNRQVLVKQGMVGDELEKKMRRVRAFLTKLAGPDPIDPQTLDDDERASLAARAWIQSHAKQDPVANIQRVKCPILILQGAKDFQVSPEKDAALLERALSDSHHPDHELHSFAGLDHLFKKVAGETSELSEYWKNRPVDAEFLGALDTWLARQAKLERH